jgi:hypothetical protein
MQPTKTGIMSGIVYITDKKNRKKAVVIDYELFKNHEEELEDILDVIIAEEREKEKSIPLAKVIANLKKKGKL